MIKKINLDDKLVLINNENKILYGYFGIKLNTENFAKRFKKALDRIDSLSDFHYENTREVCILS